MEPGKILKKVLGKKEEKEIEPRIRRPEKTEAERLAKDHKDACTQAGEELDKALDFIGDHRLSDAVELVGKAYGRIEGLKSLGTELMDQYRVDTEEAHKLLREKADAQDANTKLKEKVKKIKKDVIGTTGDE